MTAKEVAQLLSIIGNIFPNFNPKNIDTCLEAWTMVLCDEDGERIRHALAMYVKADHEFPPTPGQLITLAKPKPVYMNELEAWSLVRKAICNGIYGAEAEFAKLPPEVQRAVGDPGQLRAWAQGDIDSLQTVAQSNFCRVYRGVIRQIEDNVDRIGMADNLRLGVEE
jgi:hypothetical protein